MLLISSIGIRKRLAWRYVVAAHFIIILFTKKLLQVRAMAGAKYRYQQYQPAPRELLGFYRAGAHAAPPVDFSWLQVRGASGHQSLGQTSGQPGKPAAKKGKQKEMSTARRRQHLRAKDSTSVGTTRAHNSFSLVQNPAASNRDLHFAPTQKQLLKSWPCYRLLYALPVLAWLSEAGSSTY